MRTFFIVLLFTIFYCPELIGQVKNNGLDVTVSLIHPAKWSMKGYKYSVDPTLEILYFTSLSEKLWMAGGLFAQSGKHNWLELYGHTFYDDYGMPYPFRTDYNRQLEFLSLGIPVKLGMKTNSSFFNSVILGFTAGNYIKLNKADFYQSEFVANIPVNDSYNSIFWELNFGLRKILHNNGKFELSLSPVAGYRNESPAQYFAYYNYFYYGLGMGARLMK